MNLSFVKIKDQILNKSPEQRPQTGAFWGRLQGRLIGAG